MRLDVPLSEEGDTRRYVVTYCLCWFTVAIACTDHIQVTSEIPLVIFESTVPREICMDFTVWMLSVQYMKYQAGRAYLPLRTALTN